MGAIDVVPVVYLDEGARGAACAEALVVADRIGQELAVPVFLYGALDRRPTPHAGAAAPGRCGATGAADALGRAAVGLRPA